MPVFAQPCTAYGSSMCYREYTGVTRSLNLLSSEGDCRDGTAGARKMVLMYRGNESGTGLVTVSVTVVLVVAVTKAVWVSPCDSVLPTTDVETVTVTVGAAPPGTVMVVGSKPAQRHAEVFVRDGDARGGDEGLGRGRLGGGLGEESRLDAGLGDGRSGGKGTAICG
ncbi:hypothetical protein PG988_015792 [Apiospora saccharicola]